MQEPVTAVAEDRDALQHLAPVISDHTEPARHDAHVALNTRQVVIDLAKIGRIQEDVLSHRAIPADERDAYDYLCENGGGRILQAASRALRARQEEDVRQKGGTIVTTTTLHGRTTTTRRSYPAAHDHTRSPRSRDSPCTATACSAHKCIEHDQLVRSGVRLRPTPASGRRAAGSPRRGP